MLRRRARGFTLIELLIAVVVVAIGILGVAALQVVSLQYNRGALYRAEALQIGNDILDRLRANPITSYAPVALDDAPVAPTNCMAALANCNPANMALFDIAQWKCSISSLDSEGDEYTVCGQYGITGALPRGRGSIAIDANGVYTVRIEWIDDPKGVRVSFVELFSQI